MPERRRASRRVAGILAGAVVITAIGLGVKFGFFGANAPWYGRIAHRARPRSIKIALCRS